MRTLPLMHTGTAFEIGCLGHGNKLDILSMHIFTYYASRRPTKYEAIECKISRIISIYYISFLCKARLCPI